jgi:putative transposase
MEPQSVRKTYAYRLVPRPAQEQVLEAVVQRCRTLYYVTPEQRRTWWGRGQVKCTDYPQQAGEPPDLALACPVVAEVHAAVLHDVLRRVDKTYQAFFRRLAAREQPGYPRFRGERRYYSCTYPQYENGAVVDGVVLSLSKIGHNPVRLRRLLQGAPKTVTGCKEADGRYAFLSCAEVPTQPLPQTGRETDIDMGIKVLLINAEGASIASPRYYRKADRQL